MHERLLAVLTGADPYSASMDRPRRRTLILAASVGVALALAGGSTFGAAPAAQAFAVHAQRAGSSVAAEVGDPVPFYVVQETFGGEQEFLFEIAQRFLGDGNRFNEIFELNKGRTQPDGGALTTPTSLLPGWVLQLPPDAKGEGVQFGALPSSSKPAAEATPTPTSPSAASPSATPVAPSATPVAPSRTPEPTATSPATDARTPTSAPTSAGSPILLWIVLGVVLLGAAAAAAYIWFRKRRGSTAAPTARATVPIVDRSASWTIDSALKVLTAACDAEAIRFPGIYLLTVDSSSIHVFLSTPSAKVPSGWTVSPDGRTWSASLAYLQGQPVPEVSNAQFSRLATLGTTEAGRVLLDFQHANGPISVEGPSSAVSDVVEGWLSEFSGNPWSGSPQIVRLGERGSAHQETLEGFLTHVDRAEEGIVVLDTPPSRSQGEALRELYSAPGLGWTFIVKGAYAGASWTFTARDGVLTSGLVPDIRYPRILD
jgi:hypothetical protein